MCHHSSREQKWAFRIRMRRSIAKLGALPFLRSLMSRTVARHNLCVLVAKLLRRRWAKGQIPNPQVGLNTQYASLIPSSTRKYVTPHAHSEIKYIYSHQVVTRGIALPSRTLFQLECQWAMAHLHHGSPLGSVVRPTYPPTAQGSSLRKLFLPPRKPVSWTSSLVSKGPESYAGAIGRGPNARPSKSMKQLCDLLSEEAQKIVEQTEVEEDEPEGFGLKKIYFTTKGLGTGTVGGSDNVDSPETNIHIIVA